MAALRFLLLLAIVGGPAASAWGDAMERMRPEKLRAAHEQIEAFKKQRQPVALTSGYDDVRSLLHVHSFLSHDSRAQVPEIVAGAKEAGARVILFSNHPASHYDYINDGHRGMNDGVLLIPGAETGGFLAWPKKSIQDQKTNSPQEFSDLVRSTEGLAFLCHMEERMDWDIANLTGTEIYNTHADFMEEKKFIAALRNPLTMMTMVGTVKQYPQEVFGALLDYPADYLHRYDQLTQKARHTGISGNDSHHNQAYKATIVEGGKIQLEDALGKKVALLDPEKIAAVKLLTAGKKEGDVVMDLDLDPYPRSFRHVSTHLLLPEVTEDAVWQALREGRAYVAFDWIADPTGFVYRADKSEQNWPIGSEVPLAEGLHLRAATPLEARFKLMRNGELIHDQTGTSIDVPVDQPGVYRVEAWLTLAGEPRPWILSNPIYVRKP